MINETALELPHGLGGAVQMMELWNLGIAPGPRFANTWYVLHSSFLYYSSKMHMIIAIFQFALLFEFRQFYCLCFGKLHGRQKLRYVCVSDNGGQ